MFRIHDRKQNNFLSLNHFNLPFFATEPDFMQWVMDSYRWVLQAVLRSDDIKGFVPIAQRWKVERTFGWFNWCRRLSKDYEILPQTSEAFIYVANIRLMLRRLALYTSQTCSYSTERLSSNRNMLSYRFIFRLTKTNPRVLPETGSLVVAIACHSSVAFTQTGGYL